MPVLTMVGLPRREISTVVISDDLQKECSELSPASLAQLVEYKLLLTKSEIDAMLQQRRINPASYARKMEVNMAHVSSCRAHSDAYSSMCHALHSVMTSKD